MGERLRWCHDVAVGSWIAPRLGAWGCVVGVVPAGFDAYARILHPASDRDGRSSTWASVCTTTGRVPHALMQWEAIARPPTGAVPHAARPWDGAAPPVGTLETAALAALLRILAQHTTEAAECCFALWEGWGWIHGSPSSVLLTASTSPGGEPLVTDVPPAFEPTALRGPRLRLPGRDHLLFRGPLDAALEMGHRPTPRWFDPQSPSLIWPPDRSWCVGTEIDLDSTLVAGGAALIHAVLGDPALDAWPVHPADSLAHDADTVNV